MPNLSVSQFFHKKNLIKAKFFFFSVFFFRKKAPRSMSVNSETYNETYYKLANLPHSFGYLAGNIYVPFLLLIITLRLTCGKI